jgi:hypothetical protein
VRTECEIQRDTQESHLLLTNLSRNVGDHLRSRQPPMAYLVIGAILTLVGLSQLVLAIA